MGLSPDTCDSSGLTSSRADRLVQVKERQKQFWSGPLLKHENSYRDSLVLPISTARDLGNYNQKAERLTTLMSTTVTSIWTK